MTPEELKKLFSEGVSVVGNAESILQKKPMGEEIDSRPTIRFNWVKLENTEYTGSRKDCICTGLPRRITDTGYSILIGRRNDARFNHFNYSQDMETTLHKKLGNKPSNGARILYLLDHMEIKDVHIYGFDWKETPSLAEKYMNKPQSTPESEHHDYKKEKDFCLELIEINNWKLH